MWYIYNWVLVSYKESYYIVCKKMDGTGDHSVKQNKPDSERQIRCFLSQESSNSGQLEEKMMWTNKGKYLGRKGDECKEGVGR
jgi:hypothetical protein